jgi:low affinity Fe/Cu permease
MLITGMDLHWRGSASLVRRGGDEVSEAPQGHSACFRHPVWLVSGPLFGFSETWQLVINTGTTIVTFLMVFLIQNTQNRDQQALHLKLDELLRAVDGARESAFVDLEDRNQDELKELKKEIFAECLPGETDEQHRQHLKLTGRSVKTPKVADKRAN